VRRDDGTADLVMRGATMPRQLPQPASAMVDPKLLSGNDDVKQVADQVDRAFRAVALPMARAPRGAAVPAGDAG
jgi:hypothetical protein